MANIDNRRGFAAPPAGGVVPGLIQTLKAGHWAERFAAWKTKPARAGRLEPFPERLHPELQRVLRDQGILELRSHQSQAIEHILNGEDTLIATPTASGKTLCYTLPILQRLLETGGRSRALFLYPTKALAQDQTASLSVLVEALGTDWHASTYDGDTPVEVRRSARDRGHMILTNPHMLHQGILPNHAKWAELFRDLEFVVVDEVHSLSGVFGSSVACVLRRLLRIARHYGANPKFIACSATLRDAADHGRRLFGREMRVVDEDGSPSGVQTLGVYNPPLINPVAGLRANALEEARELAKVVCGPHHQTIFFCGRRTAVEVLTRYLKENSASFGLLPHHIRGYRGGYLPNLRREIEQGLRTGEVKVVISTNALELGVDIGALDVAVLVGYPGSQASFWQRAGRVGRRGNPSLVVMLARSEPTDQFLVAHPEYLMGAPKERLGVDADQWVILSEQIKCAAFELPFRLDENGDLLGEPEFGESGLVPEMLQYLADASGFLLRRGNTYFWMAEAYPAQEVSLAGGDLDNVVILEERTEKALGECDRESALTTCHEGAIYQVQGRTWRIERYDHVHHRAYAKPVESDYFTDAQTDTEVRVLRLERCVQRPLASVRNRVALDEEPDKSLQAGEDLSIWIGEVHVTTVATIFKKVRFYTRENVGAGPIQLPPEELDTEAFLITLSEVSAQEIGLETGSRGSAWRALGQLLRRMAPLHIRCSPSDLGISSHVRSPFFGRPTIFLYDRVQGGVGLSNLLLDAFPELLASALKVVEKCECVEGCPACVGPRAQAGPEGKRLVLSLLRHFLRQGPWNDVEVRGQVGPLEEGEIPSPFEGGSLQPNDFGPEGHYPRGVHSEAPPA
ncbi:MAG: DEAD/DEAH box helicase domain-containing protein [Planctomycetota bacterium]|jgi:DEAD/DEAH box helicase domain-containing protein